MCKNTDLSQICQDIKMCNVCIYKLVLQGGQQKPKRIDV